MVLYIYVYEMSICVPIRFKRRRDSGNVVVVHRCRRRRHRDRRTPPQTAARPSKTDGGIGPVKRFPRRHTTVRRSIAVGTCCVG